MSPKLKSRLKAIAIFGVSLLAANLVIYLVIGKVR